MRRTLFGLAIVLGLLVSGCRCPWEGRNVWLATEAAAGRTLEASSRDEVVLELPVEPGSKARWWIVDLDEKVLARKGPAEDQPGGKTVRITFDARRPGVTDLVAFYAKGRTAPPEKTFRTTVWVR
jgi:hypothetical protein